MKNLFMFILVLLLLFSMQNQLFGQWTRSNGPYGGNVKCIAVDGDNLFAGSFSKGVYLSTNNGEKWSSINNGLTNLYIFSLAVKDSIIIAGTGEGVYLSTNKGNEWKSTDTVSDYTVTSVAISDSTIFARTWFNGLFISSNFGKSWTKVGNGMPDTSFMISSIVVIENKIYVGWYGSILQSSDQGKSWINIGLLDKGIRTMTTDGTNLFVGTDTGVYQYSTSNETWRNLGLETTAITALAVTGNMLYAGSHWSNGIFISADSGDHWESMNTGLTDKNINSLVVKDGKILAGTDCGGIFLLTNNNSNWVPLNNGLIPSNIQVLYTDNKTNNDFNLYAGIYNVGISVTSDGGDNWTIINNGLTNSDVHSIICTQDNNGVNNIFIGDWNGHIYRSTDNGLTWVESGSGINSLFIESLAICGTYLFAGTHKGIYRSTDNGEFWSQANNGFENDARVYSVVVKDSNIYAGVYGGGVFVSTNKGNNWTKINNGLSTLLIQSMAIIGNNLFAGSYNDGVFISSDSGTNWIQTNNGFTAADLRINSFAVIDTIIFANCIRRIFYSKNFGAEWFPVDGSSNLGIINTLVIAGSSLYAGTDDGVWKRALSEIITSIDEKLEQLPSNFSLEQNYPNPFNSKTHFKIKLPKTSKVKISVYDIKGQHILNIINTDMNSGNYEFSWDAANMPSGMYFIRLKAGTFISTKKCLLIK